MTDDCEELFMDDGDDDELLTDTGDGEAEGDDRDERRQC